MALRPQQVTPELLSKATKALGITLLDQWYFIFRKPATKVIGKYETVPEFLQAAYPHHRFDEEKLHSRIQNERDQKFFEVVVRHLFSQTEIQTKVRKALGITSPDTGELLEIDFWLPSLKLGIEFQDKHHYSYQWYAQESLATYQKRDEVKKAAMSSLGCTLITIGFWWDKTIESVAATIRHFRPDLLLEYEHIAAEPIPLEPPPGSLTEAPIIPGIAGIMSPFIPGFNFDPTNWYAGEKHDGIRGVYNPDLQKMFSRSGTELSVLSSLLKDIPNMIVEGEIMAGRGNYSQTTAVSTYKHPDEVNWPLLRYIVFDIPDSELGIYTDRYSVVIRGFSDRPFVFSQLAFRVLLDNKAYLKMFVGAILCDAGEGVIAQQDSQYEYGRAKGLAKIKVRRDDDAQVLRINKLSCVCKLASGVTADIVFSDGFNSKELKEGDIISFYYTGYSKSGLPVKAEIYKIRYDISWEELGDTRKGTKQRSVKEAIGRTSLMERKTAKTMQRGHWQKAANIRAFFDSFARTAGFDPLVAENWYTAKTNDLISAGGAGLLKAFNRHMPTALSRAYPELKFDITKFPTKVSTGYWQKAANLRGFFDKFARKAGFDPLVVENWYLVRLNALHNAGGAGILHNYKFNLKTILSIAYPELKFAKEHFVSHQGKAGHKKQHWSNPSNVRAYFDDFARTSGFDPLIPENWYLVKVKTVRASGGAGLMSAYGYNLQRALSYGYPELEFDSSKFKITQTTINKMAQSSLLTKIHTKQVSRGYWSKPSNVKAFFDEYASASGFDPLVPENWYPVRLNEVRQAGGAGLLLAYNLVLHKALSSAYPKLNAEPTMFRTHQFKAKHGHWKQLSNVRAFLDNFARTAGFDPLKLENWYSVTAANLRAAGGGGILNTLGFDLQKVLTFAYPEHTLKLQTENFRVTKVNDGYWQRSENVQKFFDDFARKYEFDPLVADNWYPVRGKAVRSIAKGGTLLAIYDQSLPKALSHAYPELQFEASKFITIETSVKEKHGHWNQPQNVRAFFDDFAKKAGFDPLVPENWIPVTTVAVKKAGGGGMLGANDYNLKTAFSRAYPELDAERTRGLTKGKPQI